MNRKAALVETRRIAVQGGALAVDLHAGTGGGAPAVLLHGIPGWRGTWARIAPGLGRPAIVPDLAGFGGSGPLPRGMHAKGQAALVASALDALGARRFHLAGVDFGGPVAVHLWRLAPERVLSLALAATNLFTDTPVPAPLRLASVPLLGGLAFRVMFGRAGLALTWAAACGHRRAFPYGRFRRALAGDGVASTRELLLASLRDLPGLYAEVEEALPRVQVPALVAWGDRDPFFPVAIGRRSAAAIPGARFLLLEGAGHFLPEERPEELGAALRELATEAERGARPAASRDGA